MIRCENPLLRARIKTLDAEILELRARRDEVWRSSPVEANIIDEKIAARARALESANKRIDQLTSKSHVKGTFVVPRAEDLPQRFARKGTPLAYVVDPGALSALVVVSQEDVDLVRHHTREVQLRLAEKIHDPVTVVVRREVPAAAGQLPSAALGTAHGGDIPVDPADRRGLTALRKFFQFELEIPETLGASAVGGRVYVRFDHGWEPLVVRWYRGLRRLFLTRFNV